ncbi:hypothetical protein [Deinococcus marmoris]|uniref:Uncharacterized protein n=1 Tax=Deinococcus marmoris TaxID=249408 RepID=A0A1U7P324_9DEIO|nr:hypothetical protein [Deinococcus marmoris]OLV19560.1 hypothetical protein BOO71_0002419 [Deinococcus marmoris]
MTPKTAMDPVQLDTLPTVLTDAPLWRIWKRTSTGGKLPVGLDGIARAGNSGHELATAHPLETVLPLLSNRYGLGVTTGYAPLPMVVIDVDEKEGKFTGARVTAEMAARIPRLTPLIGMPYLMAAMSIDSIDADGYVEKSVSGRGLHAFLGGTAPQGHGVKWQFDADYAMLNLTTFFGIAGMRVTVAVLEEEFALYKDSCEGEIYSETRWLTVTGDQLHPAGTDTAALALAPTEYGQEIINRTLSWVGKKAHKANPSAVAIDASLRAQYVAPESLTGPLRAFRSPGLAKLWRNEAGQNQSDANFALCMTLFEILGDEPEQVNAAFITSGMMIRSDGDPTRWFDRDAGGTHGSRTITNARAKWIANGCKKSLGGSHGAPDEPVVVDWPQEARDQMLTKVLNAAKGTLSQRQAARRLLLDLFDLIDAGEYHPHGGELHIHSGGLAAISERVGGSTTSISARLEWFAMAGIISSYSRDSEGRPRIVMAASAAQCIALQEGLRPGCDIMPCRPPSSKPRKPRVTPAAPRVARDPLPRHIQRAEWTMWMIHSGERDLNSIAALTGQSARSTKKNVQDMQELNLLTDDLTPTCTRPEFRALVLQERLRNNEITRARRAEATLEYRRRMEMRNVTYNSGGYDELANAAD